MSERPKQEVKTYIIRYACDECGEEMESAGHGATNNIGTYWYYKCSNGHEVRLEAPVYPRIVYE